MTESIHVLFYVPEGLETSSLKEIKEYMRDEGHYELEQGRVHYYGQVKSITEFIKYMQSIVIKSIYHSLIVTHEQPLPDTLLSSDHDTIHQSMLDITLSTPWRDYLMDPHATFRATFKKDHVKHSIRSYDIAGFVGYGVHQVYPEWTIKMTDYDYEIMAIWYKRKEEVIYTLGITLYTYHKFRNRVVVGRTSLTPPIAYCLSLLVQPEPGEIILDMCCGTATLPIEGASRYKDSFWLGSEVDEDTLMNKARLNMGHCKYNNVELVVGDGRSLPFRNGSIDTILSDWPWGIREGSFGKIQKLYPLFMKQMYRVLTKEGKAYILCQNPKIVKRILDYDWCQDMFHIHSVIPMNIGGMEVKLFLLQKWLH
ncbi:S-adenosyl-L-methionine-dependent methyltransferase [Pilobolus umbonatus]|nr:S-adenosyl-L-methionine-dependent methyltransferase [Pilobolus umbonatus]